MDSAVSLLLQNKERARQIKQLGRAHLLENEIPIIYSKRIHQLLISLDG